MIVYHVIHMIVSAINIDFLAHSLC